MPETERGAKQAVLGHEQSRPPPCTARQDRAPRAQPRPIPVLSPSPAPHPSPSPSVAPAAAGRLSLHHGRQGVDIIFS